MHTHTPDAPWYTVEADDKRRTWRDCIAHIVGSIDYSDMLPARVQARAAAAPHRVPAPSAGPEQGDTHEVVSDMGLAPLGGVARSILCAEAAAPFGTAARDDSLATTDGLIGLVSG
jgi:hypothetical protein